MRRLWNATSIAMEGVTEIVGGHINNDGGSYGGCETNINSGRERFVGCGRPYH